MTASQLIQSLDSNTGALLKHTPRDVIEAIWLPVFINQNLIAKKMLLSMTQSDKGEKQIMSDYPRYDNVILVPHTGWRCCVCFVYAQVDCCGMKMCVDHAKAYDHGYGKSLQKMTKELNAMNTKKEKK